jgi:hypothetical protein
MELIYIMFCHYIGDFCLQTEKQGKEKSSSNYKLLEEFSMVRKIVRLGLGKHTVTVMQWNRKTNLIHKRNHWFEKYPFYLQLQDYL